MKIAINGFGRIGRNVVRALFESDAYKDINLVAINDLSNVESDVMLLKYDSVHGRFNGSIVVENDAILINDHRVQVCSSRDPERLPWQALGVDVVLECTGHFASLDKASVHLRAGAKKVLISSPAGDDVPTIVFGVNDHILKSSDCIVSNASCTTNCLAPVAKVLHEAFIIEEGFMTTVHAYTNDQNLTDASHKDIRRARAATQSMIPTKTGAASSIGLVLPELKGKLDGYALRVPVINVSMIDFTFRTAKEASVDEINGLMKKAANVSLKHILAYSDEPLVSIDFNHTSYSAIFDATQTRKLEHLYKVVAWYDNEWGFSCRMLDMVHAMCNIFRNK